MSKKLKRNIRCTEKDFETSYLSTEGENITIQIGRFNDCGRIFDGARISIHADEVERFEIRELWATMIIRPYLRKELDSMISSQATAEEIGMFFRDLSERSTL
ncbi:MAG: hypothetical protein KKF50_05485 [Nanoarchaeota archaeon]|nr:hypothetical protein [Nanoarchaeota archaeon]